MDGRPNWRNKAACSNSFGLKSVYDKLRFINGLVSVDGRPNWRNKAAF